MGPGELLKKLTVAWRRLLGGIASQTDTKSASPLQRPTLQTIGAHRQPVSADVLPFMAEEHNKRSLARNRLDQETIDLLERIILSISNQVMTAWDPQLSSELHDTTTYLMVCYAISDWRENGNYSGLDADDISDLRSFISCALNLSQRDGPVQPHIYRPLITALLDDWFDHWNADGRTGPPI